METEESELETATRELKEETGVEINAVPGFRIQIEYPLTKIADTKKQSVYFLGRCILDNIVIQKSEVAEANFLSYEDALKILTFDDTKNILKKAEEYIRNGIYSSP